MPNEHAHEKGYFFFVDNKKYDTDKSTLIGAEIKAMIPGFDPAVGLVAESGILIMFAAFFLAAASGDFLCLWIMRSVPYDVWVTDHPTRAGCLVTGTAPS